MQDALRFQGKERKSEQDGSRKFPHDKIQVVRSPNHDHAWAVIAPELIRAMLFELGTKDTPPRCDHRVEFPLWFAFQQ